MNKNNSNTLVEPETSICIVRLTACTKEQRAGIVALYDGAGWWKDGYDASGISAIIKGSFCFFIAQDLHGCIVGMGRAVSDGISRAYIQDLAVLPSARGMGIGSKLIFHLITYLKGANIPLIMLMAQPGTVKFYLSCGWQVVPQKMCMLKDTFQ